MRSRRGGFRTPTSSSSSRISRGLIKLHAAESDTDTQPKVPDAPPSPSGSSSGNGTITPSRSTAAARSSTPSSSRTTSPMSSQEEEGFNWSSFFKGPLPGKLAALVGLIVVSRVGVYVRIPGVDVDAFSAAMQSNGLLGYVDALSGGSISKVSVLQPQSIQHSCTTAASRLPSLVAAAANWQLLVSLIACTCSTVLASKACSRQALDDCSCRSGMQL